MKKRTFFIPLFLFLISPALARSEVKIPSACRVANKPPGRCGWCALETLARHLSITALYGIVDKHPNQSRPRDLEAALASAEVKYRLQTRGCRRTDILREAIAKDLGAAVGFRPVYRGTGGHIVILLDFGSKEVRLLDPNDSDARVRTMDLDTFMERWDGFALVLDRP